MGSFGPPPDVGPPLGKVKLYGAYGWLALRRRNDCRQAPRVNRIGHLSSPARAAFGDGQLCYGSLSARRPWAGPRSRLKGSSRSFLYLYLGRAARIPAHLEKDHRLENCTVRSLPGQTNNDLRTSTVTAVTIVSVYLPSIVTVCLSVSRACSLANRKPIEP